MFSRKVSLASCQRRYVHKKFSIGKAYNVKSTCWVQVQVGEPGTLIYNKYWLAGVLVNWHLKWDSMVIADCYALGATIY